MYPESKLPETDKNVIQHNTEVSEEDEKPIHYTEFKAIVVKEHKCFKVQYRSFREAQAIINCVKHPRKYANKYAKGNKTGRRVGKKDIKPIRSYRCEICGYWHLTSQQDLNDE
jgi:hypothetical protein